MRTDVTRMFQVKIGIRNMPMPGARRPKIVVMRLIAPRTLEIPTRASPTIHRSSPTPGEYVASVSGA